MFLFIHNIYTCTNYKSIIEILIKGGADKSAPILKIEFLAIRKNFIQWTVYPSGTLYPMDTSSDETLHPMRYIRTMSALHPKDEESIG